MLTETGHYNPQWLHNQSTPTLRYEARAEGLTGWDVRSRTWLLVALKQCRPAQFHSSSDFRDTLSIGQHKA